MKADEEPSSSPLGSGGGGALGVHRRRNSGVCADVGFDPSSALEEAGMTQTGTNRGFVLWHRNRSRE